MQDLSTHPASTICILPSSDKQYRMQHKMASKQQLSYSAHKFWQEIV